MRMWWSADYAIHCFFPCSTHSFYAGVADFSGVRAKFNISVPTPSQRVDETVKGTLRLAVLAPNDVAWKVDVEEFR